jgi:hypothetical protein
VIGPAGAAVSGYFVQNGQPVPISATLPFTFTHEGLSQLELQKLQPGATLALAAQNDNEGWHFEVMSQARDGVTGLRVRLHNNGLIVDPIKSNQH